MSNNTTSTPSNDPKGPLGPKSNAKTSAHLADQIPVKDPDAVQKGIIDFWGWVEDNAKWIAVLGVIGVIAGIAHVVFHSIWDRQERKAQEAYYAVESNYTKIKEGFDRAKLRALMPSAPAPKPGEPSDQPATGDLTKDYGTVVSDLEKLARDHHGTTAGAQAALLAGQTYLQYKQPDKAIELAEMPVKALGNKHLLASLSRVLWGSALATKGDCAGAVKVWQEILDNKSANFLHGEAGLRSGLCYESMNQNDKAAEMYRKVTTENAQSASASTAKGLLRALEVRGQSAPQPQPAAKG